MAISNLSDAEFKTLIIRMLKELSEDLNSIKRTQSEMKDTLTEIKNNLQGINSGVDEIIKSMIWYIREQNASNQYRKKKKSKKQV